MQPRTDGLSGSFSVQEKLPAAEVLGAAEDAVQAIRAAPARKNLPESRRILSGGSAYQVQGGLALPPFGPRERQVLELFAEGKTDKEIAALLKVSVETTETHRAC